MKTNILTISIIALFVIFGCDSTNEGNDRLWIEKNIEKIPIKVKEESERFVDETGVLHLNFFGACIPMDDHKKLLKRIFPEQEISSAESDGLFLAYNIRFSENYYNAIIIPESSTKKQVIALIIFSKGKYDKEIIAYKFL